MACRANIAGNIAPCTEDIAQAFKARGKLHFYVSKSDTVIAVGRKLTQLISLHSAETVYVVVFFENTPWF
jgi:hypothetical protein